MMKYISPKNRILIGFIILIALLAFRCLFSFDNLDESYYLAAVDRFWKGDRAIIDEWHPTQLFFLMQLPIYALYRFVVPSGDGMYLFFRFFAVAISGVNSFIVYRILNRYHQSISAFLCAVLIISFCRSNIQGISYYGIFVDAVCLMFLCEKIRRQRSKDSFLLGVITGFLFAISVACMPYQVVLFVPVLIYYYRKKLRITKLGFIVGMTSVVCYYLLIFRVLGVNMIHAYKSISFLLMDEEHSYGYLRRMASAGKLTLEAMTIPGCIIFGVMLFFSLHKRKNEIILWILFCIGSIISIAHNIMYSDRVYVIFTFYMIPVLIMLCKYGLIAYKSFPTCLVLFGIVEAVVFTSGSNMNVDAISTGMVISSLGCVLALETAYQNDNRLLRAGFIVSLLITVIAYGQRMLLTANDASLLNMTSRIESGVLKGIVVTKNFEGCYNDYLDDLAQVETKDSTTRVYIVNAPSWLYVVADWRCSNSSTWGRVMLSSKMDKYYELHPEKIPEVILLGKDGTSRKEINPNYVPSYILKEFDKGYWHIDGKRLDIYVKDKR